MEDTCPRPPEGWGENDRGEITFVMYGRLLEKAPAREGWEPYFVAVHGVNFTRWTYKRVAEKIEAA